MLCSNDFFVFIHILKKSDLMYSDIHFLSLFIADSPELLHAKPVLVFIRALEEGQV